MQIRHELPVSMALVMIPRWPPGRGRKCSCSSKKSLAKDHKTANGREWTRIKILIADGSACASLWRDRLRFTQMKGGCEDQTKWVRKRERRPKCGNEREPARR